MSPKIRVISPYLSFPCYATLHHIWQTSTSLPTVGKRKTDRGHSIFVISSSPRNNKMLYFCNGSLSRLIVKSPRNGNFRYGGQPCTDSVQILLQICSKSEPNVITGTSPIKAKDTGGSPFTCSLPLQFPIRFTTLLFYKNKTNTEQKCRFSTIRYTNPPKNFTMRSFLFYKKKTTTKQK